MGKSKQHTNSTRADYITRSDFNRLKNDLQDMVNQLQRSIEKSDINRQLEVINNRLQTTLEYTESGSHKSANIFMGRAFIRQSDACRKYKLCSRTFQRLRKSEELPFFYLGSECCYYVQDLEDCLFERAIYSSKHTGYDDRQE